MRIASAALICAVVVAVGMVLVSGGSGGDPRTPPALPGLPPPFLGTAVSGDGGLTAAVDAYGDVVEARGPGPAGRALIDNPSDRQAAGSVPPDTGIVPRLRVGGANGPGLPMWRAESIAQTYLPGTNVVRTVGRFDGARLVIVVAARGEELAVELRARAERRGSRTADTGPTAGSALMAVPTASVDVEDGLRCVRERRTGQLDLICKSGRAVPPADGSAAGGNVMRASTGLIRSSVLEDRRWLSGSRPPGSSDSDAAVGTQHPSSLAAGAPGWAQSMYRRSLLTVHALTSSATGAVAAGARDGWAYVWPRDAATAALALAASGHGAEARHVAKFLTGLDLSAAARFTETGAPVPGRAAQGDAAGWVAIAARATGLPVPRKPYAWRGRADYQESSPGTYLGNALAAAGAISAQSVPKPHADDVDGPKTQAWLEFSAHQRGGVAGGAWVAREFGTKAGLVREAGDPRSGLDSAAGWAVRPFGLTALYPDAERTLLRLVHDGTPYGITPGAGWEGGKDPWMAPTAWSAWALAGLAREPRATTSPTGAGGSRPNLPAVREREAQSHPSPARLRRTALSLLADLRHAATPAGALPERVGARTGIPTSTTPLLWSSAFAVLALRELWP